ncbi:hypothetical protein H4R35_006263 [Dimargaris xerosporica]|nr:hypothetical protein H4R35_006263 [Dimargaris xerosporica]
MNILPHKSWHIQNAKNRARVAQDEQRAQAQHDELVQRTTAAEREHRLARLRTQAKRRYPTKRTTTGRDASQSGANQPPWSKSPPPTLPDPNKPPPATAAPSDTVRKRASAPSAPPRRQRTTPPSSHGQSQVAKGVPLHPLSNAAVRPPTPHQDAESKHREDPLTSINRRLGRQGSSAMARARPCTRMQAQSSASPHSPRAQLRQARLGREHQERQRVEQLLAARGRQGNNTRLTNTAGHSQGAWSDRLTKGFSSQYHPDHTRAAQRSHPYYHRSAND